MSTADDEFRVVEALGEEGDSCDESCQMQAVSSLSMGCLQCVSSAKGMGCFPIAGHGSCTDADSGVLNQIGVQCGAGNSDCAKPYLSQVSAACTICLSENQERGVEFCLPTDTTARLPCTTCDNAHAMETMANCNDNQACEARAMQGVSADCTVCMASNAGMSQCMDVEWVESNCPL